MNRIIEIRTYNLKPGTKDAFNKLVVERSIPLLKKWNIEVVSFGPSIDEEDTYYLIRRFNSLVEWKMMEDSFYGSSDWKSGPREAILALIINYTTVIIPAESLSPSPGKLKIDGR